MLTRSADVSPPASLDPARWCLGHQLPIKAGSCHQASEALVAGNVAVLFANSVQVIGGYNLVVLRVAAEMRAGYLGSGNLW